MRMDPKRSHQQNRPEITMVYKTFLTFLFILRFRKISENDPDKLTDFYGTYIIYGTSTYIICCKSYTSFRVTMESSGGIS